MNSQNLKLQLIQWILDIQSPSLLQELGAWMEEKRREARFYSAYGAWQESAESNLMEEIYTARHSENHQIEL